MEHMKSRTLALTAIVSSLLLSACDDDASVHQYTWPDNRGSYLRLVQGDSGNWSVLLAFPTGDQLQVIKAQLPYPPAVLPAARFGRFQALIADCPGLMFWLEPDETGRNWRSIMPREMPRKNACPLPRRLPDQWTMVSDN